MKITALVAAGALAATGLAAAQPAEAQRYGYRDHSYRDYRHGAGPRRYYRTPHYYGRGRHARPRLVCRVQRGYYGPVRRCFRVWR